MASETPSTSLSEKLCTRRALNCLPHHPFAFEIVAPNSIGHGSPFAEEHKAYLTDTFPCCLELEGHCSVSDRFASVRLGSCR